MIYGIQALHCQKITDKQTGLFCEVRIWFDYFNDEYACRILRNGDDSVAETAPLVESLSAWGFKDSAGIGRVDICLVAKCMAEAILRRMIEEQRQAAVYASATTNQSIWG